MNIKEITNWLNSLTLSLIITIIVIIPIGYMLGYAIGERVFEPDRTELHTNYEKNK